MLEQIRTLYRDGFRSVFWNKHLHLHWLLAVLLVSPVAFFDVSIDITPKTTQASWLGMTSQITDYGITWTLKEPAEYGKYISGWYWVVWPVEIVRVSPDSVNGLNGLEVNIMSDTSQAFDLRSPKYNSGTLLSLPYIASAGTSLLKTVSIDGGISTCRPCTQEASILTVVSQAPSDDAFRPAYAWNNKREYTLGDINWSLLPQVDVWNITLPVYSGTDIPNYLKDGWSIVSLETVAWYFERPWLDHITDYQSRNIHPIAHMPAYGWDMNRLIWTAILRTMFDDATQDKVPAVTQIVQYAIDLEGMMLEAWTRFPWNGGHENWRKIVLTYAWVLLNDTEMKNIVQNAANNVFSENDHSYFSQKANNWKGIALLWDESGGSEKQYWTLVEDGTGFRTNKDPYGLIDGGPRAWDSYLIPINAALWKANVVAIKLMPELKSVWNDQDNIDVTYRYVEHGKWTSWDICAPFDGNISNRWITYWPDGKGSCILDTDSSDGIGRYPELHGTDKDAWAYSRYRVPLADALWNKYITNNEALLDKSISIPNSPNTTNSSDTPQQSFNNFPSVPVISYGQSVSVWAGWILSPDAHGPENTVWSNRIFTLNNEKNDFVTLASTNFRSHDQGMLERTVQNFINNYGDSPSFLSQNSGIGGRTVQELAVRPEHIFKSWTLAAAANAVETKYVFALYNGTNYDIYIDDGTSSPAISVSWKSEPVWYGNMISEFKKSKIIADQKGISLNTTVFFNWTQWQSNTGAIPNWYDFYLGHIIDMLKSDLSTIYSKDVKVVSMINQVSRYAFTTPSAQSKLVRDRSDVHFWYPEYAYNIKFPQRNTDSVGGHLSSLWYRIMWENMGYQLYDIMTQWYSQTPYISSYQYNESGSLDINFWGLKGNLIDDRLLLNQTYSPAQTIKWFVENVQSYFPYQLTNWWFSGFPSDIIIDSYSLLDKDTVRVKINNSKNRSSFKVRTWEIINGSILTSLRDSVEYWMLVPASNYGDTSVHKIRFHPFVESLDIDISNNNLVVLKDVTNKTPYFNFGVTQESKPEIITTIPEENIPSPTTNTPEISTNSITVTNSLELTSALDSIIGWETIYLKSWKYESVTISKSYSSSVTITSLDKNNKAEVISFDVRTSNIKITDLKITPNSAKSNWIYVLWGNNVALENNFITFWDSTNWKASDWLNNAKNWIYIRSWKNSKLLNNYIENVASGITVFEDNAIIQNNTINRFRVDGIRAFWNDTKVLNNFVKNSVKVDSNHDDCFQSWSTLDGSVWKWTVERMILKWNVCLLYDDPNNPLYGREMQWIWLFDGMYKDFVIEDNLIMTSMWHGIAVYWADNVQIRNNTVVDIDSVDPKAPWVKIFNHKNGTAPLNSVIENNIATKSFSTNQTWVRSGNNFTAPMDTYASNFRNSEIYDYRLKSESTIKNAGVRMIDAGSEYLKFKFGDVILPLDSDKDWILDVNEKENCVTNNSLTCWVATTATWSSVPVLNNTTSSWTTIPEVISTTSSWTTTPQNTSSSDGVTPTSQNTTPQNTSSWEGSSTDWTTSSKSDENKPDSNQLNPISQNPVIPVNRIPEIEKIKVDSTKLIPLKRKNNAIINLGEWMKNQTIESEKLKEFVWLFNNPTKVEYSQGVDYVSKCNVIKYLQESSFKTSDSTDFAFTDEWKSGSRLQIRKFSELWILNWFNDWSFKPQEWITRAEFLKTILKSHCYDYSNQDTSQITYGDVDKNSWQARTIMFAQWLWIVRWSLDSRSNVVFRPNEYISKAEAFKILLNLSAIEVNETIPTLYTDIWNTWQKKYVEIWESLWLFDPYMEKQLFNPNSVFTREDFVSFVDTFVKLYK